MAVGCMSRPRDESEEKDQINLFILDWSGVVSDDRLPVYQAYLLVRKEYGLKQISFERWLPKMNLTIAVEFAEDYGIHDREGIYRSYVGHYKDVVASGIRPSVFPDVMETFRYLKDRRKKLAVLSAHPTEPLRREAKEYGIAGLIDEMTGDCYNKGAELPRVCKRFGERKEDALYVDDTVFGIRSAKFAGIRSAGISTGYQKREALEAEAPDFLLSSLSELRAFA